jgi:hypothetical protein
MTNQQIIAKAFTQFSQGDLSGCQATIDRINKNFALASDEFNLSLNAKLYQPQKEIAERLIADGKKELVGDANYIVTKQYLNHDLKIQILFESIDACGVIEGDEDCGIESTLIYFKGHVRFDNKGISGMVSSGRGSDKYWRDEIKKLCNKWLKKEFGKVEEYDYD